MSGAKRGVPDVAGNADPVTGYPVRVDGQNFVIGGTSAVAPLMSGLTLRLNQIAGHAVGDFNALAYAHAGDFSDVTVGNNGAFTAAPGWDPTTGLGSPVGAKVLAALTSSAMTATGAAPRFPGDSAVVVIDDGRRVAGRVPVVQDRGRRPLDCVAELG